MNGWLNDAGFAADPSSAHQHGMRRTGGATEIAETSQVHGLHYSSACAVPQMHQQGMYGHGSDQNGPGGERIEETEVREQAEEGGATIRCPSCPATFGKKRNLYNHKKQYHCDGGTVRGKRQGPLLCPGPDCTESFHYHNQLARHIEADHGTKLMTTRLTFYSEGDFVRWKTKEEQETVSYFTSRRTVVKKGNKRCYYICNRSGKHKPKITSDVDSIRRNRNIGVSLKTGKTCPATITKTTINHSSAVEIVVKYQGTHFGHEMQPTKLRRRTHCRREDDVQPTNADRDSDEYCNGDDNDTCTFDYRDDDNGTGGGRRDPETMLNSERIELIQCLKSLIELAKTVESAEEAKVFKTLLKPIGPTVEAIRDLKTLSGDAVVVSNVCKDLKERAREREGTRVSF